MFFSSPQNLSRFLIHVEHNYCYDPAAPNPYHTSVHAADVTLTVAHFCENSVRWLLLLRLDCCCCCCCGLQV